MQSVIRYLNENKLPASRDFLKTAWFKQTYKNWPDFKKKNFLVTLAGIYWTKLKEEVEG